MHRANDPLPQERRRKRRFGILSRAWLWLAIFIPLVLLTALMIVWSQIKAQEQLIQNEINNALAQATELYQARQNQIEFISEMLSGNAAFLSAVQARDRKEASNLIAPVGKLDDSLFLIAWDADKDLLAELGSDAAFDSSHESLVRQINTALSGQKVWSVQFDSTGRASRILAAPTYDSKMEHVTGVLAVGFFFDDGLLHRLPTLDKDQRVVFISNQGYALIQQDGVQDLPLSDNPLPAEWTQVARNSPNEFLVLDTPQGPFNFKFIPLPGNSDTKTLMIGVGVPTLSLRDRVGALLDPQTIPLLLLIAGFSAVGFWYIFGLRSSLQKLRAAMQRMESGDLETGIDIERRDEIGDLAGDLERIRKQWFLELKQARGSEENFVQLANSIGVAAIQTDPAFCIMWANPAAETLLSQSGSELEGKHWDTFFILDETFVGAPTYVREIALSHQGSQPGSPMQFSSQLQIRNQPTLNFSVISKPIMTENKITSFVHVLLDTSAQAEVVRSRDEFLTHVSHELRAPLAKFRASLELFAEAFDERNWEQVRSLLDNMKRSMFQFQFFVENLIDIGNFQAGRFRVHRIRTEYSRIIGSALDQFDPMLHSRWKEIELELNLPTPCPVMADPTRVVQVITNLLINAIKYGGEGKPIILSALVEDGCVVTKVTDFGPGIAPEEIDKIFQRFYRGKRVESEGLGIGLGLAIAREIIEQHGGQIAVSSQLGVGTTFWFSLPLAS